MSPEPFIEVGLMDFAISHPLQDSIFVGLAGSDDLLTPYEI